MSKIRIQNAIKASLFADSLAMPVHWIYDQSLISKDHPEIIKLLSPKKNKYHSNKEVGEHTHYGDQAALLLGSVINSKTFDLELFAKSWQMLFNNYAGYYDSATKATIGNLQHGKEIAEAGSESQDLGGASRIAGLLVLTEKSSDEELVSFARAQTKFTHNNQLVIDTAEFLIRTTLSIIQGENIVNAMEHAIQINSSADFLGKSLLKAKNVLGSDPLEAIGKLGQGCSITGALPASLYLILKFPEDLLTALNYNCLAGGDSASRGLFVGMVLGANLKDKWEYPEVLKLKSNFHIS